VVLLHWCSFDQDAMMVLVNLDSEWVRLKATALWYQLSTSKYHHYDIKNYIWAMFTCFINH